MTKYHKSLMTKLRKLAKEGYEKLYERLKDANKLWSSEDWKIEYVADFNGCESKAMTAFGQEFFGEAAKLGMERLLGAFNTYDKLVWEEAGYNVHTVMKQYDAKINSEKEKTSRWSITQDQHLEVQTALENEKAAREADKETIARLEQKIQELETASAQKDQTIARLEGRVEELERFVPSKVA